LKSYPKGYEEGPDRKVRCKVCRNAKWVAFQHIRDHLGSAKHKQALESSQVRRARRAEIEQRLGVVVADQGQGTSGSGLTLANLCLPIIQPTVQEPRSEAEKNMWYEYDKYEVDFSAGGPVSDEEAKRKAEQEMDMFSIWDAVSLGRQLDGELDAAPNLAAEDDALLTEVLAGETPIKRKSFDPHLT
jgi:hypothetical protein